MLNKIALPIHSRPEFMSIYFNCSTANSPPFWIFCRGGAVLCLLLNVSLAMVTYLDPYLPIQRLLATLFRCSGELEGTAKTLWSEEFAGVLVMSTMG